MEQNAKWDKVFSFTSWLIVAALVYSALSLIAIPPGPTGPVAQLLGVKGAQIFYVILYSSQAGLLAYSKLFKKKRLRKIALMVVYLTAIFTFFLSWSAAGITWKIIDNVVIGITSFGCFLYWKFKTEYLTPQQFQDITDNLRDDLPPSP